MTSGNKKTIWIIVAVILLFSLSGEFAEMARQIGLMDALLGFTVITLFVLGIIYWIKRSKRAK